MAPVRWRPRAVRRSRVPLNRAAAILKPPKARPHPPLPAVLHHEGRAVITPTPEDEAALDATKAPLMEHLLELRSRLIWSLLSFAICFALSFAFANQIFAFLTKPLHAATNHLIY